MNNREYNCVKCWRVAIALVIATLSLLPSCKHEEQTGHTADAHYMSVDSVLRQIHDVDSLAAFASRYHDEGDATGEMLALKYQGDALSRLSHHDEALEVYNRGMDLAWEKKDTVNVMAALNGIAVVYRHYGDLNIANGYYYKILKLYDAYSGRDCRDALDNRVMALRGIGRILLNVMNYAAADSVLHLAYAEDARMDNFAGLARDCACLGSIKQELGQNDSALYYYSQGMEYNRMVGDARGVALCHLYFGKLYESERNFSHARDEYKRSYDALKEQEEVYHCLAACLSLANVNLLLGETDEARRYLLEAESEAERIHSKEHQAHANMLHYSLALMEGDTGQALDYFVKGDELWDSICGLKKTDEMRHQYMEYNNSLVKGEVSALNDDLVRSKHKRRIMGLFTALLLLMAASVIGVLVYANRMRSRTQRLLRQVEETRSLFFTNVVHMLRTPLTAIMGATDGIIAEASQARLESLSPAQRENIDTINRQGNNLLVLVDRILEVGSVRSEIGNLEWLTTDLTVFLRMVVESYRERCVERHIELIFMPREISVDVDTVPNYLSTIVGNMLENAINYSRDFSKITITSHVDKGRMTIRVVDDGMGISQTDLPHVFEPFYRGAEAEQLIEGMGIGLTVVRDMTMAMGGTVTAESGMDHGATFTVVLPSKHSKGVVGRLDDMVEPLKTLTNKPQPVTAESEPESTPRQGKPLVLVVEDHHDVARLVGRVLQPDYDVVYATDGRQGLSMAESTMPDLIITDVKMPQMDGCELCRQLRETRRLRHIPVIMLSARTSTADRVAGLQAGADAYVVKPFVREEVLALAHRLIESCRVIRDDYRDGYRPHSGIESDRPIESVGCDSRMFLEHFAQLLDEQLRAGASFRLDIDKMARDFKMGESQFRKRVQEETGQNVVAYISQLRMEKAMRLLTGRPDLRIGDVAEQCGFADLAYFSRVFKQHYGKTPTQARSDAL